MRTVETSAPDYLYAEADIVSDFGGGETWGPGATLSFAVAQVSDAVGEGAEAAVDAAIT